jgi:RNA polymerase-binding transcription factor DksA
MSSNARIAQTLRDRGDELRAELRRLTERPPDATPAVGFGKRVGDGTTEAVERINTTAAARSIAAAIAEVDRALEKVEDGTYGTCDDCGRAVGAERLEAAPWAALCVDCAAKRSRAHG